MPEIAVIAIAVAAMFLAVDVGLLVGLAAAGFMPLLCIGFDRRIDELLKTTTEMRTVLQCGGEVIFQAADEGEEDESGDHDDGDRWKHGGGGPNSPGRAR